MTAVRAFVDKELKGFIRTPSHVFWVIGWPIFWQLLTIYVFLVGVPPEGLPFAKGSVTIHMVVFAVATVGILLVADGIAVDRDRGLYHKLASLPVAVWSETIGRVGAAMIIATVAVAFVAGIGRLVGARFEADVLGYVGALPFFLAIFLSAIGLGLMIANLLRSVPAVNGVSVAVVVLGAAVSGIFMPYPFLPKALRLFSRIYPLSAGMHVVKYFLTPSEFRALPYDFNPVMTGFLLYVVVSSLVLFLLGLAVHQRTARKRATLI